MFPNNAQQQLVADDEGNDSDDDGIEDGDNNNNNQQRQRPDPAEFFRDIFPPQRQPVQQVQQRQLQFPAVGLMGLREIRQRDILRVGGPLAAAAAPTNTATTVRFSISNARSHFKQREFAEAVLNYVAVLKLLPTPPTDGRRKYLDEFLDAFRAYLRQESDDNRADQVFQIAQSIFPAESALWRTTAENFFEKGKFLRCIEMFGRAMDCARDELEWVHAASSQENARSNLFDAWHWRMLNDERRNTRFAEAILSALEGRGKGIGGTRILDIGCGSGILSIISNYSSANTNCVACERDEVMGSVARRCFIRNMQQGRPIQLHECDSKTLELAERCDVLVTETVDCAIFGERIVETLLDAKERLLSDDAIIIPSQATALFSLLECPNVAQENAFECNAFDPAGSPVALLSSACYIRPQSPPTVVDSRYGSLHTILPPSPYTCAHLAELPSSSGSKDGSPYRLLSSPVEGLFVNFNNVHQLRQIATDRFVTEIVIKAEESGTASTVCMWFRLKLFDDIEICTSPDEAFCWQQTLFPFYPPVQVSPGDVLHFKVFIKDHALHVQPINTVFVAPRLQNEIPRELLRSPPALDLLAMHDSAIRAFFWRAVRAHQPLAQVLDCTDLLLSLDDIPPFDGGAHRVVSAHPAIRYIGRENATTFEKAVCKPGSAILFWPFSAQGTLMDDYWASIIGLRILSPGFVLIPGMIRLLGCLISSDELAARSRLFTSAEAKRRTYCGVDLSPMDEYRITHFQELESRTLQFCTMSEPVELFRMQFSKQADADLGQLTKLKKEARFLCTNAGRCDAILLWFEIGSSAEADNLEMEADVRLDLRLGTRSVKSSAYILPSSISLKPSSTSTSEDSKSQFGIKAQYSLHHGNVLFHWVKEAIFL